MALKPFFLAFINTTVIIMHIYYFTVFPFLITLPFFLFLSSFFLSVREVRIEQINKEIKKYYQNNVEPKTRKGRRERKNDKTQVRDISRVMDEANGQPQGRNSTGEEWDRVRQGRD